MKPTAARRAARLDAVESLGQGLARVELVARGIGTGVAPGRFAMVEAPGRAECILLRPYSYFLAPDADRIALLVREVGNGTRALVTAPIGTPVAVVGPLGNTFPTPAGPCWVVAGGVGAAPFGEMAQQSNMRLLFGARSSADAGFGEALRDAGASVSLATDDGSAGFHGTVTAMLMQDLEEQPPPSVIYTCGPEAMMVEVVRIARAQTIPCWVSLEQRMACGFGVCRGCAHRDASGAWRCICEDGPVYEAGVIFPQGNA
ncbi:MAG: hypothetical protein V3T05_01645 [Myxococcota bacterium]